MEKFKLIVLVGEAGSGKDSVLKELYHWHDHIIHPLVSYTTRPRREGEIDGKDYYFVKDSKFFDLIDTELLEYTMFNGWWYGAGTSSFAKDKVNIGIFNPSGIESLMKLKDRFDFKIYYLRADAKERLMRQLRRESNPDVDEIVRRYSTDKQDFEKLIKKYGDDIISIDANQPIDEVSYTIYEDYFN